MNPMEPIAGLTLEKYAELCAAMRDAGGDPHKNAEIAAQHGVSRQAWEAAQQGWTPPVWTDKAATDAAFEQATRFLFASRAVLRPAIAGHNLRSLAHALACAAAAVIPTSCARGTRSTSGASSRSCPAARSACAPR